MLYQEQLDAIKKHEARIKTLKDALKEKQIELELKLRLKRVGVTEEKAETRELLRSIDEQTEGLDPGNKEEKRKLNAIQKDKDALEQRLAQIDRVMTEIGGQLTLEEAKTLILKKLYDLANEQLTRYLNAEKRALVAIIENLWDKYAVSSRELETEREKTMAVLEGFISGLGYLA